MNGAVFQTSAMMITISACGSCPSHTVSPPRIVFTRPCGDSKIERHMKPVTTVRIAHGIRITVRSIPWPRNAACMAIAMARPMTSSSDTLTAVKISVVTIASQKSGVRERLRVVAAAPPSGTGPATRTLYSCSDSQMP